MNSGKTLKYAIKVNVADIVHHGDKLILPEKMDIDDAISLLKRRKEYLGESVVVRESFDVFPQDGAVQLDAVLTEMFGWSPATPIPGFWGPKPPEMMTVEVGPGEVRKVPWGRFSLPNTEDGFVQCDTDRKGGRYVFSIVAKVLRRDEETINRLFSLLRNRIAANSIYRGKAIKLRFLDEDGEALQMPEPKFMNVSDVNEGMLVYAKDVEDAITTNLFTPIQRANDCIANGITLKRGVLLGGTFGTGKTMAAKVAAALAVECGITYVYIPRADELSHAIEFARQYQSPACVLFCEDIDRALAGERTVEIDDILNVLDGVDSKSSHIITVLTTNDLGSINRAMLRPGRLDAVIEVTPPDAYAVERLLRLYGGDAIPAEANLDAVGEALKGTIPAVIAEVVKRAKLAQLRRQNPGEMVRQLTEEALIESARTMSAQLRLLADPTDEAKPTIEALLRGVVEDAVEKQGKHIKEVHERFVS